MLRDLCGAEIGIEVVYAEINRDLGFKSLHAHAGRRSLPFAICWEALAEDRILTIYTFSYIF